MFFSYDGQDFETHNTEQEARDAAEDALEFFRSEASDGWDDESMHVCWGRLMQTVQVTRERPAEPDDNAKNSPKEKPHFFRVAKSELLQQLSGNAVKVVLAVLKREDDLFYRQRVAFFNEELEELTGLSKRTVMQAREDAVNAGFLKYVPGSKSIRGIYSTAVPENIVATRPKTRSLYG